MAVKRPNPKLMEDQGDIRDNFIRLCVASLSAWLSAKRDGASGELVAQGLGSADETSVSDLR